MCFICCYKYVLFLFYNIKNMIELQYKLKKAIEEERYEDAAEIKKQIDELKTIYKSFFDE